MHFIARLENLALRQTVQRSLLFHFPVNRSPTVYIIVLQLIFRFGATY